MNALTGGLRSRGFIVTLLAVLTAIAVWVAIESVSEQPVVTVLFVAAALVTAAEIPVNWVAGRRRWPGVIDGPPSGVAAVAMGCTVVPFSRVRALRRSAIGVAPFLGVYAAASVLTSETAELDGSYLVSSGVAALIFLVITGRREDRFEREYLGLSPHLVRLWGGGEHSSLSWDDIASITLSVHGGRRYLTIAAVPGHDPDGAVMRFSGDFLDVDPVLVEKLLRFYFQHPDLRAELGTAAAGQRAKDLGS